MSSLYNLEPQPTASCILHTTYGDISLELFAQQTPLTCRNFLQQCLDGYYDNTIFHRLVPGFILQGGDPTGTGSGGESVYDGGAFGEEGGPWPLEDRKGRNAGLQGVGFKDEVHSRLRFNRRGVLGMANEGEADSNGSQFFLTLGETPELTGKNTVFGRVAPGDTIYNVMRMGEGDVIEGTERMRYPVKISGVEVLVNPFKEMVARKRAEVQKGKEKEKLTSKPKKRKGGKQLLSFGAEEGEGGEDVGPVVKKTKFDTRIAADYEDRDSRPEANKPVKKAERIEKTAKKPMSVESSPEAEAPVPAKTIPNRAAKVDTRDISSSPEPVQKVSTLLDRTNAEIAQLKASMKRHTQVAPVKEKKKSALEQLIPETAMRGRKRRPGGAASSSNDQQALDILRAFQSKLDAAPPEKEITTNSKSDNTQSQGIDEQTGGGENDDDEAALCDLHFIANCQSCQKWDVADKEGGKGEEDEDDDDRGWMSHALSFAADKLGKDLSYRKKAEEELVVIDPREKARTLKEEKRAEREARKGGEIGTGREWDRDREKEKGKTREASGLASGPSKWR